MPTSQATEVRNPRSATRGQHPLTTSRESPHVASKTQYGQHKQTKKEVVFDLIFEDFNRRMEKKVYLKGT